MRRIPTQVADSVSRLLKANHLQEPPTWYLPVISNPPPNHPLKRARPRPDLSAAHTRKSFTAKHVQKHSPYKSERGRPRPISYREDPIRQKFFADFPFEAMRPTSLVEMIEVDQKQTIEGKEWTSLSQRGSYPTVEDTISFTLNLFDHSDVSMSQAYAQATSEFIKGRANHEMASMAAELEARFYGAEFKPDQFQRYHRLEREALDRHLKVEKRISTLNGPPTTIRYRKPRLWSTHIPESIIPAADWSGGKEYALKWRVPPPPEENVDLGSLHSIGTQTGQHTGNTLQQQPGGRLDGGQQGEEEMDDLEFLHKALRGSSKTR